MTNSDPILTRFKADIQKAYGNRVSRVVLFGSRARGDARPGSDYDVAVFLNDMKNRWDESDRIAAIASAVMDETGAFVHAMPHRASAYQECTPLMSEIRREGRDLWRLRRPPILKRRMTVLDMLAQISLPGWETTWGTLSFSLHALFRADLTFQLLLVISTIRP